MSYLTPDQFTAITTSIDSGDLAAAYTSLTASGIEINHLHKDLLQRASANQEPFDKFTADERKVYFQRLTFLGPVATDLKNRMNNAGQVCETSTWDLVEARYAATMASMSQGACPTFSQCLQTTNATTRINEVTMALTAQAKALAASTSCSSQTTTMINSFSRQINTNIFAVAVQDTVHWAEVILANNGGNDEQWLSGAASAVVVKEASEECCKGDSDRMYHRFDPYRPEPIIPKQRDLFLDDVKDLSTYLGVECNLIEKDGIPCDPDANPYAFNQKHCIANTFAVIFAILFVLSTFAACFFMRKLRKEKTHSGEGVGSQPGSV